MCIQIFSTRKSRDYKNSRRAQLIESVYFCTKKKKKKHEAIMKCWCTKPIDFRAPAKANALHNSNVYIFYEDGHIRGIHLNFKFVDFICEEKIKSGVFPVLWRRLSAKMKQWHQWMRFEYHFFLSPFSSRPSRAWNISSKRLSSLWYKIHLLNRDVQMWLSRSNSCKFTY